jgi:hypothetical protein
VEGEFIGLSLSFKVFDLIKLTPYISVIQFRDRSFSAVDNKTGQKSEDFIYRIQKGFLFFVN